jgi:lipoprotein-anchoring transpeptidase ErfK/SrfK
MMRTFMAGLAAAALLAAGCAPPQRKADADHDPPGSVDAAGKAHGERTVEVDLTEQRLRAFEGDELVYDFRVSTGKRGKTPTGTFTIWKKHVAKDMKVEIKMLDKVYFVPNVPYVMFFYNEEVPKTRGFAVHGTYWHKDYGQPVSHGCVNMKTGDARKLFYWTGPELRGGGMVVESKSNPGTRLIVYGEAPGP